jgi:hypothetical protein
MSRTTLTIDRLILSGFDPAERGALVAGLRAELSRVLADPATRADWARSHHTPVLRLPPLPLHGDGSASGRQFGRGMAQGLARSVGKGFKP